MKKVIFTGASILSTISNAGSDGSVMIDRFNATNYGINFPVVEKQFQEKAKINLNWKEVLSVSGDKEGKNIKFGTADGITITVPVDVLSPAPNKGEL